MKPNSREIIQDVMNWLNKNGGSTSSIYLQFSTIHFANFDGPKDYLMVTAFDSATERRQVRLAERSPLPAPLLHGKYTIKSTPQHLIKSITPSSEEDATSVHPKSMTHIIMIVDKSESLQHLPDLAHEVRQIWAKANPLMADVLARSTFGVPTYYIEANRYYPGTREVDSKHLLGSHLKELQVPSEHSVFVQLLTIEIDGKGQDITLETVYRTESARCIVSEKPLMPHVD